MPASVQTARLPADPRIRDFQDWIRTMYLAKDTQRGLDGTFLWFMAEVGELAESLRNGTQAEREGEFADVLAWLTTVANVAGVDLAEAVSRKFGSGCPGCGQLVCKCSLSGKP